MDSRSFDLYTQFLVQRGFSVLQVNYRGSTGHGREFIRELYDDWGGAEQGDVASAAEHVLSTREWLDDERVVVFGGSYGGYSAYWQRSSTRTCTTPASPGSVSQTSKTSTRTRWRTAEQS